MAENTENGGGRRGSRWRIAVWATVTGLILLLPLFAMQVTDEVVWDLADFAFVGALRVGGGAVAHVGLAVSNSGAGANVRWRSAVG